MSVVGFSRCRLKEALRRFHRDRNLGHASRKNSAIVNLKKRRVIAMETPKSNQRLPNPVLIRDLYDLYYVMGTSGDGQDSSHWREYSKKVRFRLDETGLPVEMSGYGFGDLEVRSWPYRVLCLLGMLSYLAMLPGRRDLIRIMRVAWPLCRRMGLSFALDAFRQVCSLSLIERYLSPARRERKLRIIIIGDGYGLLASLFKERFPNSTIVLVDLGRVSIFQAYYCQKAHPGTVHRSVLDRGEVDLTKCDFVYCPAEFLSNVSQLTYDVSVNIASMQEMTTKSLIDYFQFLRQQMETAGLFYCCNRERKVLVGGEVQEFSHYPWHARDVHLVDERCPWQKYYFAFITTADGPRLFGLRIPFVNYYDGPTRHRLTQLYRAE